MTIICLWPSFSVVHILIMLYIQFLKYIYDAKFVGEVLKILKLFYFIYDCRHNEYNEDFIETIRTLKLSAVLILKSTL